MNINHIGVIVENIEKEKEYYTNLFGYSVVGEKVSDPLQEANVLFLESPNKIRIELVEPADENSSLNNALKKGIRYNHICYEVEDMKAAVEKLKVQGCIVVKPPLKAAAFDQRLISFLFTPQKELIELVETE